MAKQQTFGDKLKKSKDADFVSVKVITWKHSQERGTLRSVEKFVRVKDLNELTTIEI